MGLPLACVWLRAGSRDAIRGIQADTTRFPETLTAGDHRAADGKRLSGKP